MTNLTKKSIVVLLFYFSVFYFSASFSVCVLSVYTVYNNIIFTVLDHRSPQWPFQEAGHRHDHYKWQGTAMTITSDRAPPRPLQVARHRHDHYKWQGIALTITSIEHHHYHGSYKAANRFCQQNMELCSRDNIYDGSLAKAFLEGSEGTSAVMDKWR